MKKIFASFCLLAFTFLTFNVTPAFSREVIKESVHYNVMPGASYTTTKVSTKPTRMTTGEKVGAAIAATALVGGIIALAAVSAHEDRPPYHEYRYDNYRGHNNFHHNPPPPKPSYHGPRHDNPHNLHKPPMHRF